ncbi:H4MPT-linked C1 transfer pathway protein, partial [Prosthecomicrobium hirschii]|uniref:hydantoinase/oxoprolinase family protein n=1 Tax=Prosthecodimorpha hirschii TaxID=665126 RepID=UPI0015E2AD45
MRRIGWDIGGAHLKAAVAEDGRIVAVVQEPCALWQGLDRLDAAFAAVLGRIGAGGRIEAHGRHQATMTGELVDLFSSRAEGVAALAARAAEHLGADVTIYAGRAGQIAADNAAAHADDVASANWHATARLTAAALGDGLLIDMGSTTTDIIPVRAGAAAARGYSDAERLATGELVYTGVVRTPLMALAADIPFAGRRLGVMAEHFATSADIWRLLGRLPEGADQHGTADGRGKSVAESRLRLSRMVGVDVAEASAAAWMRRIWASAKAAARSRQAAA